jgi:hypothetical protein
MADKPEEKEAPSEAPKTEETADKEKALDQSINNLTDGKFKSVEDLAKAYKEAESKIGEQGDEIRQVREFMSVAQPVFDVIRDDQELFKTIDTKLRQPSKETKESTDTATDQEDVRSSTRNMIVDSFEAKHNITKLPADEQRKFRNAIGEEIRELMGTGYDRIDLRRLNSVLEKAYILAKDRIKDKSTLEALEELEQTEEGSISSIPSKGSKEGPTLTPDEASVAEKLGLTRDQYLSGK